MIVPPIVRAPINRGTTSLLQALTPLRRAPSGSSLTPLRNPYSEVPTIATALLSFPPAPQPKWSSLAQLTDADQKADYELTSGAHPLVEGAVGFFAYHPTAPPHRLVSMYHDYGNGGTVTGG